VETEPWKKSARFRTSLIRSPHQASAPRTAWAGPPGEAIETFVATTAINARMASK
jgi:hypothetical protein